MPSLQINTRSHSSLLPVSCLAAPDQELSLDPCLGLSPVMVPKPSTEVKTRSEGFTRGEKCPLPFTTFTKGSKTGAFSSPRGPTAFSPTLVKVVTWQDFSLRASLGQVERVASFCQCFLLCPPCWLPRDSSLFPEEGVGGRLGWGLILFESPYLPKSKINHCSPSPSEAQN